MDNKNLKLQQKDFNEIIPNKSQAIENLPEEGHIPATYEELWQMYFVKGKSLHNYVLAFFKETPHNAEDILSHVFLVCLQRDVLGPLPPQNLVGFLVGTARNSVLEHFKEPSVSKHNVEDESMSAYIQNVLKHEYTPERAYTSKELVYLLSETVQSMAEIGHEKKSKRRWIEFPQFFNALLQAFDAGVTRNKNAQRSEIKYRDHRSHRTLMRPGIQTELAHNLGWDHVRVTRAMGELRSVLSSLCS